uniref:Uncharacterized protein n=1 Tax=Kalanchoe fedtschenkoi TaxID=63787 RepID=A0A7N0UG78_KALFE
MMKGRCGALDSGNEDAGICSQSHADFVDLTLLEGRINWPVKPSPQAPDTEFFDDYAR